MWTRIIHTLILYVVMSLLALASGQMPGMISIHPSTHASYISHSRCMIDADVPHQEFLELRDWCTEKHLKENPPK